MPLYLLLPLDDDLYAIWAAYDQVKMLSARKADKKGLSAGAVVDALFRVVLAPRFRPRGEEQNDPVELLL